LYIELKGFFRNAATDYHITSFFKIAESGKITIFSVAILIPAL